MKSFFWNLAVGDQQILYKTKDTSGQTFKFLGAVICFLWAFTFLNIIGVFFELFGNFITAVLIGSILSFMILTIYRLNLISLEPNMLPHIKEKGLGLATIIRLSMVLLFSFYITSAFVIQISVLIYHHNDISNLIKVFELFYKKNQTITITIFCIVSILFILPILIKYRLRKNNEYFNIKGKIEKDIIESDYKKFIKYYKQLFSENYNIAPKIGVNYQDPPYNTIKKQKGTNLKCEDDFINQYLN
jgi:hypothetical protein